MNKEYKESEEFKEPDGVKRRERCCPFVKERLTPVFLYSLNSSYSLYSLFIYGL
jgi:hypothetical protein